MKFRILDQEHKGQEHEGQERTRQERKVAVAALFTSVFTHSEGEQEGKLIGDLASVLAERIDNQEIICIVAEADDELIGAIFFTRLKFDEDIDVFMLSPVAVSTTHQGSGVGQALIRQGLRELGSRAVKVAITYGDPSYYAKVGFQPLSQEVIQAPLPLSMPQGWLGQALQGETIPTLTSRPTCVQEFDNAQYW